MANKIAFVNNKGGSGKTTTTTNIAGAIHQLNPEKKILIFDVDAQANAGRQFDIEPNSSDKNAYDVFRKNVSPEEAIINTGIENIDMITGGIQLNFFEFNEIQDAENLGIDSIEKLINKSDEYTKQFSTNLILNVLKEIEKNDYDIASINIDNISQLKSMELQPDFKSKYDIYAEQNKFKSHSDKYFSQISGIINEIDQKYDFILFDTPPDLHSATSSIMSVADQIIVPFTPDNFSLDGINNIIEHANWIKENFNPELKIGGLLITNFKKQTIMHTTIALSIIDFATTHNIPYFTTRIPNGIRIASATAREGVPATLTVNPKHISQKNKAIKSYYDLIQEWTKKKIISLD